MLKEVGASGVGTILLFLGTSFAQAQTLTDPLKGEGLMTVVNNVTHFLEYDIAIPLSVIMVLIGSFQFMTGGGDPEKISQARKTILYAAVGLGVALMAGGVASLVTSIINGS